MERFSKSSQQIITHHRFHVSNFSGNIRRNRGTGENDGPQKELRRRTQTESSPCAQDDDAQVIRLCKYVPCHAVSPGLALCAVIKDLRPRLQSVNIAPQSHKTYTWRTLEWDRDEDMREKTCSAAVQQLHTGKKEMRNCLRETRVTVINSEFTEPLTAN